MVKSLIMNLGHQKSVKNTKGKHISVTLSKKTHAMKKTALILALMTLLSSYCLANDSTNYEDYYPLMPVESELLIHFIDCNDWINTIPEDIEPIHIDPADQLDLNIDEMNIDNENIHFDYLLHTYMHEA